MPYQKEEKSRNWGSSSNDEYNKSGQDDSRNGLGKIIKLLFIVALVGGGYLLVSRVNEIEWPSWLRSVLAGEASEESVEPYRYELEIPSDSVFFTLHPKGDDYIPYKKLNYDNFLYYSIQNSAQGLRYGVENGELAQMAFELQQVSSFGYCSSVCSQYKQIFSTDFVYDVLRMTRADDTGEAKATIYDATFLLDIVRRDPSMRHDARLLTADLMNALNSDCLDSIEHKLYRGLQGRNIIAVWKNCLYITDILGSQRNLLQALSESPSLQDGDAVTYEKAMTCALEIVNRIVAICVQRKVPEDDIIQFRLTAQQEIEETFVPGAPSCDFSATQQALSRCIGE